jgi:hypothetical protein
VRSFQMIKDWIVYINQAESLALSAKSPWSWNKPRGSYRTVLELAGRESGAHVSRPMRPKVVQALRAS